MTLEERFMLKVSPEPMSGCWLWTGNILKKDGYGQTCVLGANTTAHRAAWRIFRGALEPHIFVCHKCDNVLCVNPDHMFTGTQSDNMFDMHRKRRHFRSRAECCPRGHEYTPENIVRKKDGRRRCRTCENSRRRKYYAKKVGKVLIAESATWDIASGVLIERKTFPYSGPIDEAKGDGKAAAQLNLENQLTKQQLDRQNSMQDAATQAVKDFLSGNKGFAPDQLAAMRSQFLNSNSQTFNDAGSQVRAYLASKGANGGTLPVGGDTVRGIASLEGARASSQSSGLLGLDVTNAQQALSNLFNASNVFSGNAASSNVGTFNGGASGALNSYIAAANTGFGNAFTSGLGGALGKGIGAGLTGGIGNLTAKVPGMSSN